MTVHGNVTGPIWQPTWTEISYRCRGSIRNYWQHLRGHGEILARKKYWPQCAEVACTASIHSNRQTVSHLLTIISLLSVCNTVKPCHTSWQNTFNQSSATAVLILLYVIRDFSCDGLGVYKTTVTWCHGIMTTCMISVKNIYDIVI